MTGIYPRRLHRIRGLGSRRARILNLAPATNPRFTETRVSQEFLAARWNFVAVVAVRVLSRVEVAKQEAWISITSTPSSSPALFLVFSFLSCSVICWSWSRRCDRRLSLSDARCLARWATVVRWKWISRRRRLSWSLSSRRAVEWHGPFHLAEFSFHPTQNARLPFFLLSSSFSSFHSPWRSTVTFN